jgi:hypothetical protein
MKTTLERREDGAAGRARVLVATLLAAVAALVFAAPALAQTYVVGNLSDTGVAGDGSLRGEIKAANASPGADTIEFAPNVRGMIPINGSGYVIEGPLDIEGPGPEALAIEQSASNHRVFQIKLDSPGEPVTIAGLTLRGGDTNESGGDIENTFTEGGALTVSNCHVINGYAKSKGGGIDSIGRPLTVRSSLLEGNEALSGGGAIWAGANAPLTIEGTTFRENFSVETDGGALVGGSEAGFSTVIADSTFVGNRAPAAGGAISWIVNAGGVLSVANSTFVANHSGTWGGAMAWSSKGTVAIVGSTIAGNVSEGNQGAGGLENFGPNLTRLDDSIVAGNTSLHTDTPDLVGKYETSFDLLGDTFGASFVETVSGSDLTDADPQLAPLADNGGPVPTMALPATSPAVNRGAALGLATDARGEARPSNYPGVPWSTAAGADGADIGAYELQAPVVPGPPSTPGAPVSPPPPAPKNAAPASGPPRVRLSCAKSAGAGGCKFALQVVSGKPRHVKGKSGHARVVAPKPESAVAKLKLGAGKSGLLTLVPKAKFAARLDAARSLLVREALTAKGKTTTAYRRLKVAD